MKRILLLMMMLTMLSTVCFANEQWEFVESSEFYNEYSKVTFHNEYYLDVSNIKKVQIGMDEIIKAKVKVSDQTSNEYQIHQYWVNSDTKRWKVVFIETYKNDKLTSQKDLRNLDWDAYDPNNKIVNEILKRTN